MRRLKPRPPLVPVLLGAVLAVVSPLPLSSIVPGGTFSPRQPGLPVADNSPQEQGEEQPLFSSYDLIEFQNTYTFEVAMAANKVQIRRAIEHLFEVAVTDVRTQRYLGKQRRMGRSVGTTGNWKKAVIRLKEGDSIDFY